MRNTVLLLALAALAACGTATANVPEGACLNAESVRTSWTEEETRLRDREDAYITSLVRKEAGPRASEEDRARLADHLAMVKHLRAARGEEFHRALALAAAADALAGCWELKENK
jgi:predicted small lipoprotein YifL